MPKTHTKKDSVRYDVISSFSLRLTDHVYSFFARLLATPMDVHTRTRTRHLRTHRHFTHCYFLPLTPMDVHTRTRTRILLICAHKQTFHASLSSLFSHFVIAISKADGPLPFLSRMIRSGRYTLCLSPLCQQFLPLHLTMPLFSSFDAFGMDIGACLKLAFVLYLYFAIPRMLAEDLCPFEFVLCLPTYLLFANSVVK